MKLKSLSAFCAGALLVLVQSNAESSTVNVSLSRLAVSQDVVNLTVGDTVVWDSTDGFPQLLSAAGDSADPFTSTVIQPGSTFTRTFKTPGTVFYKNLLDPRASGVLLVRPVTGPATFAVDFSGPRFNPGSMTITAGDTVIWNVKNTLPAVFATTSGSAEQFVGLVALTGKSFSHTFLSPGSSNVIDLVTQRTTQKITVLAAPPPAAVPVPGAFFLFGSGLLALASRIRIPKRSWPQLHPSV